MAKYDNRFLVQYFKDIYALYILQTRVKERIEDIESVISDLSRGKYYNPYPKQPKEEYPEGAGCLLSMAGVMGVTLVVVVLINIFHDYGGFGAFLLVICGILFFFCLCWGLAIRRKQRVEMKRLRKPIRKH